MRALLALILAAAPLAAGPSVRWIEKDGTVHDEEIHGVDKETAASLEVRLKNGKRLVVEGRFLLDLRREDERDDDQRALLQARRQVERHEADAKTIEVLDRLSGSEGWVGEHASAYRAILAARSGEEGATKRVESYLEKHRESRLACDVRIARAWLLSRDEPVPEKMLEYFITAAESIEAAQGPIAASLGAFVEMSRRVADIPMTDLEFFVLSTNILEMKATEASDYATFLIANHARTTVLLEYWDRRRRAQEADGQKVYNVLSGVKKLWDPLLLPETRASVQYSLGSLYEACGFPEQARRAYEAARNDAVDPRLRSEIDARLGRLKKSG